MPLKGLYKLSNYLSAEQGCCLQGGETGAHQLGNTLFSRTTLRTGPRWWHSFWLQLNVVVPCHASKENGPFATWCCSCSPPKGEKMLGKCCCSGKRCAPSCANVIKAWMCLSLLLEDGSPHPAFQATCTTHSLKDDLEPLPASAAQLWWNIQSLLSSEIRCDLSK